MKHAIAFCRRGHAWRRRSHSSRLPNPAPAHGTAAESRRRPNFKGILPNVPGKSLIAVEVVYPPGGEAPSHTHQKSAFIYAYVLSGEVISAVDDEEPRRLPGRRKLA